MGILELVEEVRGGPHMRLRMALERAGRALEDLKQRKQDVLDGKHRKVDMFGDPVAKEQGAEEVAQHPLARLNLAPMIVAWRPFEEVLLGRVDAWEMDLWPLVRRWTMGEQVGPAVQTVASGMLARRTKLEPLLREVRNQVSFVGELRAPVMAVFSALEACDDAEAGVVQALISGRLEDAEHSIDTQPPRVVASSDQIARNLRSTGRPTEGRKRSATRKKSGGLLGSLRRMLGD